MTLEEFQAVKPLVEETKQHVITAGDKHTSIRITVTNDADVYLDPSTVLIGDNLLIGTDFGECKYIIPVSSILYLTVVM